MEQTKTETAWLIEKLIEGQPVWFSGLPAHWTGESLEAVRFVRKQDAEKIISFLRPAGAYATEHQWG